MKTTQLITFGIVGLLAIGGVWALANSSSADEQIDTTDSIAQTMSEDNTPTETPERNTILDVAASAGSFNTLLAAIDAAGLEDVLSGEGPYTVFAPTDAAFDKLAEGTVESLLEDPETLAGILTYHVVAGEVTSDVVVTLDQATTVQGQDIHIAVDGDRVHVNDATVTAVDIPADNGVIHVIDTVLIPQ